ncbi:hypothetical protein PVL29_003754 [Vitis rotundifolia]|uniref:Uncharacterized protein n=1 Tax=Vitis rotundifolia TaxID=103349 RepID=A0AA39ADU6_VITRO|nr:hypothetical protein PVL29_003754 [Vitis rotundifolia]
MVSEMYLFQVPQINTDTCDNWSIKMNDLVGSQDVWEDETTLSPNQRDILKDTRKRDKIALTVIHQAMNGGTFEKISNTTTSKEVYEILQNTHKGVDKVQKICFKLFGENLKV